MDRREFLKTGVTATAALTTLGASFWQRLYAAPAEPGPSPYGPLGSPDPNGIRLPAGFTSREIARSGENVPGTGYIWHAFPDGAATFATPDGGWTYVSNSETPVVGGAGAVRFNASGAIVDAYRILVGTSLNCAGGATPWGTWLSCEEHDAGLVWECDPTGATPAVPRPALGTFSHEAAAIDPTTNHVYLTEDKSDGRFYRFTPAGNKPDLSVGTLEVMVVDDPSGAQRGGSVTWKVVPNPNIIPGTAPTRMQVPTSAPFRGGEGAWYDHAARTVYFTTKGDVRVWAYKIDQALVEILYDYKSSNGAIDAVDNIIVSRSGDIFVAEDGGNLEIGIISVERTVAAFLQVTGQSGSEICGPAFDPSGTRLYLSSQRGNRIGITYEVSGPFRE